MPDSIQAVYIIVLGKTLQHQHVTVITQDIYQRVTATFKANGKALSLRYMSLINIKLSRNNTGINKQPAGYVICLSIP